MAKVDRVSLVKEQLTILLETLYRTQQINKVEFNDLKKMLLDKVLMPYLVAGLYSSQQEAPIPGIDAKVVRLAIREIGKARESLVLAFLRNPPSPSVTKKPRAVTCLVGHRFTEPIERTFRLNLRQLFEAMEVQEEYSGVDPQAVMIMDDLLQRIKKSDFCLFDNRETSNPSKPNVYIEAGMAIALNRPFIFCNYKGEAWPTDFSNMLYLTYDNYNHLFQQLASALPIFLKNRVKPKKEKSRPLAALKKN